ncbi:hypothetical protein MKW94_005746 [Papaver nudicaule]|uniref:RING-type domain-containing protein n=1 Tax=Papaver nudicaule TaxID=74823 RepID=A0AA41SIM1_PAPNU|nr:hypothetical protein [Papaver nudicaule]
MNSPNSDYNRYPLDYDVNGHRYFIGIAAGVIMFIVTIAISSFCCTRGDEHNHLGDIEVGLDEVTLESYPKLLYWEAKLQTKHTTADGSCCSICLADYKSTDVTRILPDCGHFFHQKCVDPWLLQHPTCPICRASPLPTPQTSPLVNVMPPSRDINRPQVSLTISSC